jgi:hypothetical protein
MPSACSKQADGREGAYVAAQATPGVARRRSLYVTDLKRRENELFLGVWLIVKGFDSPAIASESA